MKNMLRKIFSPILNQFESGSDPYSYKPSHRLILIIMGVLFSALASVVYWFARGMDPVYLLPVVIFYGLGLLSLLVGLVGTDRGVAKIWGSR